MCLQSCTQEPADFLFSRWLWGEILGYKSSNIFCSGVAGCKLKETLQTQQKIYTFIIIFFRLFQGMATICWLRILWIASMYETVLTIFYTTIWYVTVFTLNTCRWIQVSQWWRLFKAWRHFHHCISGNTVSLLKKSKVQEKYNTRDK